MSISVKYVVSIEIKILIYKPTKCRWVIKRNIDNFVGIKIEKNKDENNRKSNKSR